MCCPSTARRSGTHIAPGCASRRSAWSSRRTTANASWLCFRRRSKRQRRNGHVRARKLDVIELRRAQLSLAEGLFAEEVGDLWEDWMRHVDQVLTDPELLDVVFTALGNRWPHSRTRGRKGTPADVVLRLLVLKHMRNWSYAVVEREVRANLVYRQFTRVGAERVPDAKTLGKLGIALGPEIIEKIHQRVVAIAQEKKIVHGRRMRVDTTVVETDIHYPTDSTLLGDGVRVLTRAMKKISELVGAAGTKLRDRTRSTRYCLINIGRASRSRLVAGKERLQQSYARLLDITGRVVGQAKRFINEVRSGVKRSSCLLSQACVQAQQGYLQRGLRPRPRGQTGLDPQPLHQERRTQKAREAAMVPQRPEVAHRSRGTHQPSEEATRSESMSLQRPVRGQALGRTRRHQRQPHQHRPRPRSREARIRTKTSSSPRLAH